MTSEEGSAWIEAKEVVVVVRPGRRTGPVLLWLRQLLPTAAMLVAPAGFQTMESSEVDSIVVEADEIDSPLSLAEALTRRNGQTSCALPSGGMRAILR